RTNAQCVASGLAELLHCVKGSAKPCDKWRAARCKRRKEVIANQSQEIYFMKRTDTLVAGAIAGVLALGLAVNASGADEKKAEVEKCFGVAKAGKNDCATSMSSCAGTSKKDGNKD